MIVYETDPEFLEDGELLAAYRASPVGGPRRAALAAEIERRGLDL